MEVEHKIQDGSQVYGQETRETAFKSGWPSKMDTGYASKELTRLALGSSTWNKEHEERDGDEVSLWSSLIRCSELPAWLVVTAFTLCLPVDSVQLWSFLWSCRTGSYM